MRWAGHIARAGEIAVNTEFWWGNLREGDRSENPGVDGRIILKCILEQWDGGAWTGSMWLRIGVVAELL